MKDAITIKKTIQDLRNKIKAYTQNSSKSDYRVYLAHCSRLLILDSSLNNFENLDDLEDLYQNIKEIEEEVNRLTSQ